MTRIRVLGWLSALCIGSSMLLMALLCASGAAAIVARIPRTLPAPPWWYPVHLSAVTAVVAADAAIAVGAAGVVCGLIAVRLGARPPARLLLLAALTAIALLTVVPPASSTDSLSYAADGRLTVLGHSPYLVAPIRLIWMHDPVGRYETVHWNHERSPYGPLATGTQWLAAWLGGSSMGRILFWLKAEFALGYAGIAVGLHRLLRRDRAAWSRACLLWSVNPVLLWASIATAHIDVLACGLGLLGLVIARPAARQVTAGERGADARIGVIRALAAGVLIGGAAAIKPDFIIFGLGLAWVTRRSLSAFAAAVAGGALVLVPGYALARGALRILTSKSTLVPPDTYWRFFKPPWGLLHHQPHVMFIAGIPVLLLAALLGWRLPAGRPELPAIRLALAATLAWLLIWPMQRPWYDAMAFSLLAVFPASRLDWIMLGRLTPVLMETVPGVIPIRGPAWLHAMGAALGRTAGSVRLAALLAVLVLCATAAWGLSQDHGADLAVPPSRLPSRQRIGV
jgi:hypothetical protein